MVERTDELEYINKHLKNEARLRKRTEEELKLSMGDLKGRVKELECLYSISHLLENETASLDQILRGMVLLIPPAMRDPDMACVRLVLDGLDIKTADFSLHVSQVDQ